MRLIGKLYHQFRGRLPVSEPSMSLDITELLTGIVLTEQERPGAVAPSLGKAIAYIPGELCRAGQSGPARVPVLPEPVLFHAPVHKEDESDAAPALAIRARRFRPIPAQELVHVRQGNKLRVRHFERKHLQLRLPQARRPLIGTVPQGGQSKEGPGVP